MVYGDDPQKWNEYRSWADEDDRDDPLGLHTYTYKPEPTAAAQAGNLYGYCLGNPVLYRDISGQSIILACILVGAAAGAIIGGFTAAQISKSKLGYVNGKWVLAGAVTGGLVGGLAGWGAYEAAAAIGAHLAVGSGGTLGATIVSNWQKAEEYVRSAYHAVRDTFSVPGMSDRVVDGYNAATKTIYEVKYGYASYSQFIQTEVLRDAWLIQNDPGVRAAEWHFFKSVATGQGGPSGPLLQALSDAGIKVIFH